MTLCAVALVSILGLGLELAIERHWGTAVRLIPWAALVVLLVTLAITSQPVSAPGLAGARAVLAIVMLSGLFGVAQHAIENYNAGPLDERFAVTWDGLGEPQRVWLAMTKGVGPAPTLAPAVLAQIALIVLIAASRGGSAPLPRT